MTTAPDAVLVEAGTSTASADRVPPFGETFQFGPRTSSDFAIVMFSA